MYILEYKKFINSTWIGPVKILNSSNGLIKTNLGEFENKSNNLLKPNYTYILRISDNMIIDTGMSCVDLIILVDTGKNYKFLSIKRGKEPFKGMWALPGGNIDEGEKPIDAAVRELKEETNITVNTHNLFYVGYYEKANRDPRMRNCLSHAYCVVLNNFPEFLAGDDADECIWNDVSYNGLINVKMAFDHGDMIKKAIKILNRK